MGKNRISVPNANVEQLDKKIFISQVTGPKIILVYMDNNLQLLISLPLNCLQSHHVLNPSAGVTSGPPKVTVAQSFVQHVRDPDEIEVLGMWCAPVVQVTCPSVAVRHFTKKEISNESLMDENEIKNVYEIYKKEFEIENDISEINKNEFDIQNDNSEIDKNLSEIDNELENENLSEITKKEVVSEGYKWKWWH